MDGPYRVEIERTGPSGCHLRCVDEHGAGSNSAEWTGSLGEILETLFSAAKGVNRACYQQGWESSDTSRLSELIDEFREAKRLGA